MTLDAQGRLAREIGWRTAATVVVANMVGAGIFTTSGFMARDLGSPWWILALWAVGGLVAFAGSLAYAELGAAMPEAGGEYVYLREAYGPLVAYLSGWTSFSVGFSGALAAALLGFAGYLGRVVPACGAPAPKVVAIATLWALTAAHVGGVSPGGKLHSTLTAATFGAIVAFIAAGFTAGHGLAANFLSSGPAQGNAAVSLIFVLYAYSGWNAAVYLAGEIREPERGIPIALLGGTALVTALYLGLNALYLYALPIPELAGVLEIGEKAALALFGSTAATFIGVIITLALLSSASAMVLAGPRVYYAMARDRLFPGTFATVNTRLGTPVRAIVLQSAWTSVLIVFFGAFEPVVVYTGFAVTVFAAIAVAAVVVLRVRRPQLERPFMMPGYPWLPVAYVAVSAWIVGYAVASRRTETILGLVTVGAGVPLYHFTRGRSPGNGGAGPKSNYADVFLQHLSCLGCGTR